MLDLLSTFSRIHESLPCGHSFCLKCLESMDVTYNMTSCPLCGSQYGKEKTDLKQLPKNYALRNMSDKIKHTDGEQDIVTANNGWLEIFITIRVHLELIFFILNCRYLTSC